MRRVATAVLVFWTCVGWARFASAQTNLGAAAGEGLDPINPSARVLALGGAFIGRADDVSAVVSNPAGLRQILKKEVIADFRWRQLDSPFPVRGHLFGSPTGIGRDTVAGLETATTRATYPIFPGFVAVAVPQRHTTIAVYWSERGSFNYKTEQPNTFEPAPTQNQATFVTTANGQVVQVAETFAGSATELDTVGGAIGVSITPRLSVGFGINASVRGYFSAQSRTSVATVSPEGFAIAGGGDAQAQDPFLTGDQFRFGFNVGVTWRAVSAVQVGFVHHQDAKGQIGVFHRQPVAGGGDSAIIRTQETTVRLPDRTGGGVAIRLTERAHVMADIVRVRYSTLSARFVDAYALSDAASQASFYRYPDVTEFHVGGEYIVPIAAAPVALRGGWWRDPPHAVIYSGTDSIEKARFPIADTAQDHFSAGAGVVIRSCEFDVGFDTSTHERRLTVSFLGRF